MGIIVKTITNGFRTSFFRNQPVHQFYGHLQAVLRDIDSSGEMDDFFAKPFTNGDEMEWTTELNGQAQKFKDLPAQAQKEIATKISANIDKIKAYAESKQGKTGKEKDYADYLQAVAIAPNIDQIFVVNNKPVLVHWGFVPEGPEAGGNIYAGWDEFIAEIQRKSAPEPVEKTIEVPAQAQPEPEPKKGNKIPEVFAGPPPQSLQEKAKTEQKKEAEVPAKEEAEKPKKPKKEKKVVAAGLGDYVWVKWLAILLAIIILLLLLLRLLPPKNPLMPNIPGMSGAGGAGGMGGIGGAGGALDDLLKKAGGGGGARGGSGSGSGNGKGSGLPGGGKGPKSGKVAPGQPCPYCGHVHPRPKPSAQPQDPKEEKEKKDLPQTPEPSQIKEEQEKENKTNPETKEEIKKNQ